MKHDLFVLRVSLLDLNQLLKPYMRFSDFDITSFTLCPSTNALVSSANILIFPIELQLAISLMKTRNSRGPRTDPCGTPHFIVLLLDFILPRDTYWHLFVR